MSLAARRPSGHKHERAREHARKAEREYDEGRMGFLEHLDELRTRLIRACIAVGAGMLVSFALVGKIQEHYGHSREDAEREVDEWSRTHYNEPVRR